MPENNKNNVTVLDAVIERNKKVQEECAKCGIKYEYEIFVHEKYVIAKTKDLDSGCFEYHLYGRENAKNKGFICTYPRMFMAMDMIGMLEK